MDVTQGLPAALLAALALGGCAGGRAPAPPREEGAVLGLDGCAYGFARAFTGRYCVDCHSASGNRPERVRAYPNLDAGRYAGWRGAAGAIPGVLDPGALEGAIMPPPGYPRQPTQDERRRMLEWLRAGSPNTPAGR